MVSPTSTYCVGSTHICTEADTPRNYCFSRRLSPDGCGDNSSSFSGRGGSSGCTRGSRGDSLPDSAGTPSPRGGPNCDNRDGRDRRLARLLLELWLRRPSYPVLQLRRPRSASRGNDSNCAFAVLRARDE